MLMTGFEIDLRFFDRDQIRPDLVAIKKSQISTDEIAPGGHLKFALKDGFWSILEQTRRPVQNSRRPVI
jgi:3-isopropylmalate dehydratase small subunit